MPSVPSDLWDEIEAELAADDVASPVPVPDDGDWLRRAPYSLDLDAACARVAGRGGVHRVLAQGRRCRTVDESLRTLGDALELPGYYGRNLDALDECLRELLVLEDGHLGSYFGDRVGRDATGVLLTVDSAEDLLADAPVGSVDKLVGVLRRGARPGPDPLGRPLPRTASFHVLLLTRDDRE